MSIINNSSNSLCFFVNGKEVLETQPDPEWSLLYYLRTKLNLTGSKSGCEEGGCGACTAMVSRVNSEGTIKHFSVNACLTPVVALHGTAVTTIEGVGSVKTKLHPIQERLAFAHGSQCGFCTPGVIMSMYSLLRSSPTPTMQEIEEHLVGNLCRCTGYRPIVDGFRSFSAEFNQCGKENCCRKGNEDCIGPKNNVSYEEIKPGCQDIVSNELIFPPKLLINQDLNGGSKVFRGPRITWYVPTTLEDLLELKNFFPEAKIVAGNTILGNEAKYKPQPDAIQIQVTKVPELNYFCVMDHGVRIGAAVGLSDVEIKLKMHMKSLPEHKNRILKSLLEMLQWFGNRQTKNVATFGGNIMAASAVSSIMQILLACGARINIKSANNERFVVIDEEFYIRDTKISEVKQNEVIMSIFIPYTKEREYFEVYRQARRRANDSAIVNAGMKVIFEEKTNKIVDLKLAFGAVAKTVILAPKTMKGLRGLCWNDDILEKSTSLLFEDIPLELGSSGGSVHYRRTLILSFFLKFYLKVRNQLSTLSGEEDGFLPANEISVLKNVDYIPLKTGQLYDEKRESSMEPIGKPMIHSSGIKHTTGEAIFINDMPLFVNELFGALVISQKASAIIERIDPNEALKMEGVVKFLCHKDIDPLRNITGFVFWDEEVFATKEVHAVGQIIGVILATTKKTAQDAAKRIKIDYTEKTPILSLEEAIGNEDGHKTREIQKGNVAEGFRYVDQILEGEIRIGGQEHFYMETHACIAVPKEDGGMEIYSSVQNLDMVQTLASKVLTIPANKITAKNKRVGGGFGGKETNSAKYATVIAFAASKVGKPVRLAINREIDMVTSGKGHPFLAHWKAGFNKEGVISSLDIHLYLNAGSHSDLSPGTAEKALQHIDNVYNIANLRARAKPCKTNTASNTAFRGFGTPQAMFVMEDIMTRVARALNFSQTKVREINMYPVENPETYYGYPLKSCSIRKCWDEVLQKSDYHMRMECINKFNRENKYHKRGIAVAPTKQGIGYGFKNITQTGALVHIYLDGSIILSHGAIEMGQGVHVKMIQVASKELGVPPEKIYTAENSTDKIPNAAPTAGSASADLNGMAVLDACRTLKKRLSPYYEKNTTDQWESWVKAVKSAFNDQVQLSSVGFYKDENVVDFDFITGKGNPYPYFSYGTAVTEVEIDVLTGDHKVLRVDIVVDAGNSLNPAVDIGQIEGAYVQAYGMFTLEELLYDTKGHLRTNGPYSYKLPTVNDIPREFNVSLLRESPNPAAIYSSKGIGEAPYTLGVSAYSAIKMAILATRKDKSPFRLDAPATSERIRMACKDAIIEKAKPAAKTEYEKWSVAA